MPRTCGTKIHVASQDSAHKKPVQLLMKNQLSEIQVSQNLTWESARVDSFLQDFDCGPPCPIGDFTPNWYKLLKGDLCTYRDDSWRYNHTARYCKGLQGLRNIGWTIPLPVDITHEQNTINRRIVVPEMLYGTMWNDKDSDGEHVWNLTVIFWPWRARLTKDWQMMTTAYHLDWSPDWFSFAGMPPANYNINTDKNGIGAMYQWEQPLDTENYDYYNIETVHAFRRGTCIPKDAVTFSLTIIPPEQGNQ